MVAVRHINLKRTLDQIPGDLLAFDLELANSFRNAPPVISMIGVERYDAVAGCCLGAIASITRREQEPQLVSWFLERLGDLAAEYPNPALLTFSGTENDLPWLWQRMERFSFKPAQRELLEGYRQIDLKAEFRHRTQSDQMSLKNLERIFGITRESPVTSQKVSFILTDVLRGRHRQRAIPEKLFEYLHQDVHHLLEIYNRWADVSLEDYRITDQDYLGRLHSLRNGARRSAESSLNRRGDAKGLIAALKRFRRQLDQAIDKALIEENFAEFVLPDLPTWTIEHPELTRLGRKYKSLQAITVRDKITGAYQLRQKSDRTKGALAVVRQEGKVLMIRRAEHLKRAAGYWGLPGGALEQGETPESGALRELREEVGLSGSANQVLGTSISLNGEYTLYWVEIDVADPTAVQRQIEEVAEVRWVAPGELQELDPLIPGAQEGFRRFLGQEWTTDKPET